MTSLYAATTTTKGSHCLVFLDPVAICGDSLPDQSVGLASDYRQQVSVAYGTINRSPPHRNRLSLLLRPLKGMLGSLLGSPLDFQSQRYAERQPDMSGNSYYELEDVYTILDRRERLRLHWSTAKRGTQLRPEHAFYSTVNSLRNKVGNRYTNILSYDRTSIVVDGEYLNANVLCDGRGDFWVASQAPLPFTFHLFFRAIYSRAASSHPEIRKAPTQHRNAILVQLTGWTEGGRSKADPYLPAAGETHSFNHESAPSLFLRTITHTYDETLASNLTELELSESDAPAMRLLHYHFEAWPDHGVPTGPGVEALRCLVNEVERLRDQRGGIDGCEVWVHCSAGVGRTGAFIAMLMLRSNEPAEMISPLGPLPEGIRDDRVACAIDSLREYRGMLVQTPDQLRLVYEINDSS